MDFTVKLILSFLLLQANYAQRQSHSQSSGSNLYSNDGDYYSIPRAELINTAQETIEKMMQGVCNPRELNQRFNSIESQMAEHFNDLKMMILNVGDKLKTQEEKIQKQHSQIQRSMSFLNRRKLPLLLTKTMNTTEETKGSSTKTNNYLHTTGQTSENSSISENSSNRHGEIEKYNATIRYIGGKRAFSYYWDVRDISYRMKNWGWQRYLKSSSFYLSDYGYRMYIKLYPNKEGRNVFINVGLTKGAFDNSLEWPFKLKHKVRVINHKDRRRDLISRVWDPQKICSEWNWKKPVKMIENYECVGLGFSKSTLLSRGFILNDAITVKLTVYMN